MSHSECFLSASPSSHSTFITAPVTGTPHTRRADLLRDAWPAAPQQSAAQRRRHEVAAVPGPCRTLLNTPLYDCIRNVLSYACDIFKTLNFRGNPLDPKPNKRPSSSKPVPARSRAIHSSPDSPQKHAASSSETGTIRAWPAASERFGI